MLNRNVYGKTDSEIKQQVKERDDYTCVHCGNTDCDLEVHHLTYKNAGNEFLTELVTLCESCHNKIHPLDHSKVGYKIIKSVNKIKVIDFENSNKEQEFVFKSDIDVEFANILCAVYDDLLKYVKRVQKKRQYCERGISVIRAKNQLFNIYRRIKKNYKYTLFYNDVEKIINELKIGDVITTDIVSEYNKIGNVDANVHILDIFCCLGKLKRNNTIIQVNKDNKEEKIDSVQYVKVMSGICPYFLDDIKPKKCPGKCGSFFGMDVDFCDFCTIKQGKNKGEPVRLRYVKRVHPLCSCVNFKPHDIDYEIDDEDDEDINGMEAEKNE